MKTILLILITMVISIEMLPIKDCKCKDISLHGDVQFVTSHPDFRVKVVDSHADLEVKIVNHISKECGEWRIVNSHAKFRVQFVESHEDFKIKYRR